MHGFVRKDGSPLPGAVYVRLVDGTSSPPAKVRTSATGCFRFYAAAGDSTLRTLFPGSVVDAPR